MKYYEGFSVFVQGNKTGRFLSVSWDVNFLCMGHEVLLMTDKPISLLTSSGHYNADRREKARSMKVAKMKYFGRDEEASGKAYGGDAELSWKNEELWNDEADEDISLKEIDLILKMFIEPLLWERKCVKWQKRCKKKHKFTI